MSTVNLESARFVLFSKKAVKDTSLIINVVFTDNVHFSMFNLFTSKNCCRPPLIHQAPQNPLPEPPAVWYL